MKRKTGVVVKVDKDYICVRTIKGEFLNLKPQSITPNIGDIYSGPLATPKGLIKRRILFIFILVVMAFIGRSLYQYFTPSASVILTIPPTIQVKVNKWNKIVEAKPTSTSGRNLLKPLDLKHKNLDKGLELIIEEAKNANIVSKNYIESNHVLTIYISSKDNQDINLTNFKSYIKDRKIKYQINNNGSDMIE